MDQGASTYDYGLLQKILYWNIAKLELSKYCRRHEGMGKYQKHITDNIVK